MSVNGANPLRVLIVDDHQLLREGLRALIDQASPFSVVGTAASAREALQVVGASRPDLAIVDVRLDGPDGIECIKQLRTHQPAMRFVVLTMLANPTYVERARRAGAHGFVSKSNAADDLLTALEVVGRGGTFFPAECSGVRAPTQETRLTDREILILDLVGAGHSNKTIGTKLGIAAKTVDCHKQNLRRKLGMATGAALRAYARSRYLPADLAVTLERGTSH